MKFLTLLLSLACAALLSVLVALYASGRLTKDPAPSAEPPPPEDVRASLFPEQSRAVEELLQAIIARQEALERQETLLDERENQIRQETIVLSRMREELAVAKKEIDAYLAQMDQLAVDWDADERKNTRKLAEFYARMDPQNAARLLSNIETDRAARILTQLSDRQAGAIMDAAVALGADGIKLAVEWTDIIRQMKEPRKSTN
ncbi:MAG: hypothetical protein GX548_10325 [Lentisphaerae bacterium]|nr:hypothetical protein [Lentisphaerota bacterium]